MKSLISKKAIDANGYPIPWYTYCFIHFLETKIPQARGGFEFLSSGLEIQLFGGRVERHV